MSLSTRPIKRNATKPVPAAPLEPLEGLPWLLLRDADLGPLVAAHLCIPSTVALSATDSKIRSHFAATVKQWRRCIGKAKAGGNWHSYTPRTGDLYYNEHPPKRSIFDDLATLACVEADRKACFELMEWLVKRGVQFYGWEMRHAAGQNNLAAMKRMRELGFRFAGEGEEKEWVGDGRGDWNYEGPFVYMTDAILAGHLECVVWLHEQGCPIDNWGFSDATAKGRIAIVRWMLAHSTDVFFLTRRSILMAIRTAKKRGARHVAKAEQRMAQATNVLAAMAAYPPPPEKAERDALQREKLRWVERFEAALASRERKLAEVDDECEALMVEMHAAYAAGIEDLDNSFVSQWEYEDTSDANTDWAVSDEDERSPR